MPERCGRTTSKHVDKSFKFYAIEGTLTVLQSMSTRKQILPSLILLLLGVFCAQVHSQPRPPKREMADILPYVSVARDPLARLLPVVVEGKCGFIDRNGKIVVQPVFDTCNEFADERAVVKAGSKTLVINEKGKTVFDLTNRVYGSKYSDGLISVCGGANTCAPIGYLDKEGRIAIQPQFDTWFPFSDGRALIHVDNKWGYIDKQGKTVIPPKYLQASPFKNGMAQVHTYENTAEWRGARWYYIDKDGKIVRSQKPREPENLMNGFAPMKLGPMEWTLIDETGQIAFHPQFDTSKIFVAEHPRVSEGLIRILEKGLYWKWGYADVSGRIVIQPQFYWANHFSEGLAVIHTKERKYGYIDKTGTIVIKAQFDKADDFIGSIARVEFGQWLSRYPPCRPEALCVQSFYWDGEMGYIDKTGQYIWKPTK